MIAIPPRPPPPIPPPRPRAHLRRACGGKNSAAPGFERLPAPQRDTGRSPRVERAAAGGEDIVPRLERLPQSGMIAIRARRAHRIAPQRPGAAMDGEGEAAGAGIGGRRGHYWSSQFGRRASSSSMDPSATSVNDAIVAGTPTVRTPARPVLGGLG